MMMGEDHWQDVVYFVVFVYLYILLLCSDECIFYRFIKDGSEWKCVILNVWLPINLYSMLIFILFPHPVSDAHFVFDWGNIVSTLRVLLLIHKKKNILIGLCAALLIYSSMLLVIAANPWVNVSCDVAISRFFFSKNADGQNTFTWYLMPFWLVCPQLIWWRKNRARACKIKLLVSSISKKKNLSCCVK